MFARAIVLHSLRAGAVSTGTYWPAKRALDALWRQRRRRSGSFSQFGEDAAVLDRLGADGLYLDIGSSHPYKGNNTYLLYCHGWRGMAIEPIQSLCNWHGSVRPRDICMNAGAGSRAQLAAFHELNPVGFSTFDAAAASQLCASRQAVAVGTYAVPVVRAAEAWTQHFGARSPDFVSIDTEGFELDVLDGLDLERLRPRLLLVEFRSATGDPRDEEITERLRRHDYVLDSVFGVNGLFRGSRPEC